MKNVAIITQARTGSSRLPNKIFRTVLNKPLLHYHLERLQLTGIRVMVGTTSEKKDAVIHEFCKSRSVTCYSGSESDVQSRFLKIIEAESLDVVIRVTSDCPLIDPKLIQDGLQKYLQFNSDRLYLSNTLTRTFARGMDFEIFSASLLQESSFKDTSNKNKEHVTPYLYSGADPTIQLECVLQTKDRSFLRITVDEEADFKLIERLISEYGAHQKTNDEIEQILLSNSALRSINGNVVQKIT